MTTVSLKLPEVLLHAIEQEARARGLSKSALIRGCVEKGLNRKMISRKQRTYLELMGNLVGSFRGPRDLSTNRRYLLEAVAQHARRNRKDAR